jgi:hypothetical protein
MPTALLAGRSRRSAVTVFKWEMSPASSTTNAASGRSALLKSDLIDRFYGFRSVKPRKSNLAWRSVSSNSLISVVV